MNSVKLRALYDKYRREGVSARLALQWARDTLARESDPRSEQVSRLVDHAIGRASYTALVGDYTVTLKVKPDDLTPEDAMLGRFQSKDHADGIRFQKPDRRNHHVFVPDYTVKARARALNRMGVAKGPAWVEANRQVREDIRAAQDYAPLWASVDVQMAGVTIQADSCGGFVTSEDVESLVWEALDAADKADHASIFTEAAIEARREATRLAAEAYKAQRRAKEG